MRVKTYITIDKDLLSTVDRLSGNGKNRSKFIQAALESYIKQRGRNEMNFRDLEIINQEADELNREALDVLDYQVTL